MSAGLTYGIELLLKTKHGGQQLYHLFSKVFLSFVWEPVARALVAAADDKGLCCTYLLPGVLHLNAKSKVSRKVKKG